MDDDLRSFANSDEFKKSCENSQSDNKTEEIAKKNANQLFEKYKNYSKSDLTQEIANLILTQKKNGVFNKVDLLSKIDAFAQFIPAQNILELKGLIEEIDAQN